MNREGHTASDSRARCKQQDLGYFYPGQECLMMKDLRRQDKSLRMCLIPEPKRLFIA